MSGQRRMRRGRKNAAENSAMPRRPANQNARARAAQAEAVRVAATTENFVKLLRAGGLDPAKHLRFANWSGADFRGCDLRGFDFTGARLIVCDFSGAQLAGARFDQAEIDHVQNADSAGVDWGAPWGSDWGTTPTKRTMINAADWDAYVAGWKRPEWLARDTHLPVGAVFQDAPFAPEMVVIPPGKFIMGGRYDPNALPGHEVVVPGRIAVARYLVTFAEWDFAAKDDGVARYFPDDSGWGRDRQPVINVSWDDAKAYTEWLKLKTGQPYRLMSEIEWEYCSRAPLVKYGTGPWGVTNTITWKEANFADHGKNNDDWEPDNKYKTMRVGYYTSDQFGLYDIAGNVREWMADTWHDNYQDKPFEISLNGGAWEELAEAERVTRGASWNDDVKFISDRTSSGRDTRSNTIGFRVARTLII